jgi:hypothetical protein
MRTAQLALLSMPPPKFTIQVSRAMLHVAGHSFSTDHLTTRVFSPTSPSNWLLLHGTHNVYEISVPMLPHMLKFTLSNRHLFLIERSRAYNF